MSTPVPTAHEVVKHLMRYLNGTTNDDLYDVISELDREHSTLQQSFTRLCAVWLKHLAALPEGHYDLRNQASIELARHLVDSSDLDKWRLPLI